MAKRKILVPHTLPSKLGTLEKPVYQRIAVPVDFSNMDEKAIQNAIAQGGKGAHYLLIHIVETAGAIMFGSDIDDFETESDNKNLNDYVAQLRDRGYDVVCSLGYGNPRKTIPEITKKFNADMLVMGAHGHKTFKDIIFGTTVGAIRHGLNIPVLVVR